MASERPTANRSSEPMARCSPSWRGCATACTAAVGRRPDLPHHRAIHHEEAYEVADAIT